MPPIRLSLKRLAWPLHCFERIQGAYPFCQLADLFPAIVGALQPAYIVLASADARAYAIGRYELDGSNERIG
jgi:hypothetical protein